MVEGPDMGSPAGIDVRMRDPVSSSLTRVIQGFGLALLCSCLLSAEKVADLTPTNYVDDFAHALDGPTQQRLNEECRALDQRANAQLAVVTVKSLEGVPIEDFANQLFRKWGIGGKKTDRGVLVLLAVDDRRYRVEVGYGLESILNDAKVGTFAREMLPQLRAGDYSGAATLLTGRIADVIAEDAKVAPVSGLPAIQSQLPDPNPSQRGQVMPGWITFALLGLFFFVIITRPGRALIWFLLSMVFSGGGRVGGGGGSGRDGGGGFGGFGGGSSGGGGASGDW